MVCWSCEDCKRNPVIHEQRGFCGAQPFSSTNPFANQDPNDKNPKTKNRWYVDGTSIFGSARGQAAMDTFTHCPVGEATRADGWVQSIFTAYRRSGMSVSGALLNDWQDQPEAYLQAVEEAHCTAEEIRGLVAEITRLAAKNR